MMRHQIVGRHSFNPYVLDAIPVIVGYDNRGQIGISTNLQTNAIFRFSADFEHSLSVAEMKTRRPRDFLIKLYDNAPDMRLRGEREAPIHRAEYVRQKASFDWKFARFDVGQSIFSQQMPLVGDQVVKTEFVRIFAGMLAEIPRPNAVKRDDNLGLVFHPNHTANLTIAYG